MNGSNTRTRFGPPKTIRTAFKFTDWARQPKVQKAWEELIKKYNLQVDKLQDMDIDRIFSFTDGSFGGALDLSMNKARKLGWHGFVDTNESMREVLDDFAKLRMIPPVG